MKKNSTLQQKLKSYSAVAGAVAATAAVTDANAQVIYTDQSPDVTVNTGGSGYPLDMDNDGTADFTIGLITGTYSGFAYNYVFAYSTAPTTNQIDTVATGGYGAAFSHNAGDNISAANLWNIGAGTYYQHLIGLSLPALSVNIGEWQGDVDKYLGVKFAIGMNTHYGWARMDVAADGSSFTVKDYAYNGTASSAILAGDMGVTGIASAQLTDVKVFSTEKQININMGETQNATVIVRDMTGREVYTSQLNASLNQIDMSTVSTGIYTVTINTIEGRSFTKKVSVK